MGKNGSSPLPSPGGKCQRGLPALRGNHKRGERSAPSSLILSPPLRFPLRLSFLIPLLSVRTAHVLCCFFVFCKAEDMRIGGERGRNAGARGRSNLSEAAFSGVYCAIWERSAYFPRREMPARAPRPHLTFLPECSIIVSAEDPAIKRKGKTAWKPESQSLRSSCRTAAPP